MTENTYEVLGTSIGMLVDKKQLQYGDSFHKSVDVLKIFYPNGIKPEDYQNLLTVVRIVDKLFRVTSGNQGDESAFTDIAGYGLLGISNDK